MERRETESARTQKSHKNHKKVIELCLLGPTLGVLLEASWAFLGRTLGPLEPSWSVGKLKGENSKILHNLWKINDLCLLGPSWEASWKPLGLSWSGRWGLLSRLGASGTRKSENSKIIQNPAGKSMFFSSWGLLGKPFGSLFFCDVVKPIALARRVTPRADK